MRFLKCLILVLSLSVISGCFCSFNKDPELPNVEPAKKTIHVDEELLRECKPFTNIKASPSKSETLLQHSSDVEAYNECMRRQARLAKLVRESFNIEK